MAFVMSRSTDRPHIDSTHLNPIVQVITWVLLAISTMALIFRLLTRCYLREKRNFAWEDSLILCSYIFTLVQSVTMLLPEGDSLGNTESGVSTSSLNSALKVYYISNFFFILSLSFAKLSVCAGFLTLSPFHHRITYSIGVSIIVWALSSLFAAAFQCGLPQPWNNISQACAHRLPIHQYIIITNMITDISLIVFPISVLSTITMPTFKRLAIMGSFFARTLTIGATAAQLVFVGQQVKHDFTLSIFPYLISTQIVLCTSMIFACVVYIWPFLKALQSGLMWSGNIALSTISPATNSRNWLSNTFQDGERRKGNHHGQYAKHKLNGVMTLEPMENMQAGKQGTSTGPHAYQED